MKQTWNSPYAFGGESRPQRLSCECASGRAGCGLNSGVWPLAGVHAPVRGLLLGLWLVEPARRLLPQMRDRILGKFFEADTDGTQVVDALPPIGPRERPGSDVAREGGDELQLRCKHRAAKHALDQEEFGKLHALRFGVRCVDPALVD